MAVSDDMRAHYDRLANSYNDNWVYNPEFVSWMTRQIVDRLQLRPDDRVVDLGCGTGLYSAGLAEHANQVLCIDPSAAMLEQIPGGADLIPIQASAEQVASGAAKLPFDRFDAVLVKEAIHHVNDRWAVLHGLARMLAPGGRLLVVMLPTRISYPLFRAALELFERLQPDPGDVAAAMRDARLTVDLSYESFDLMFDKNRYLEMVRSRYMSLLSSFDDAALEHGVAEISRNHPDERLDFADRQAFVLGVRD